MLDFVIVYYLLNIVTNYTTKSPILPHQFTSVQSLSPVRLYAIPWTVAHKAPLSMGFSRQEHWNGLPFPSPGALPNPMIKPIEGTCPNIIMAIYNKSTANIIHNGENLKVFLLR